MAVLVTGGAGYIGSHTVVFLKEQAEEVILLDHLQTGHRQAVRGDAFYEGDLRDGDLLDRIFTEHDIDAVVHFAAHSLVGESAADPLKYYENNLYGTLCLLRKMIRHDVNRIVFSSTAAVYGEPERLPIREMDPTRPTNPYGETKRAIEKMLHWCEQAHGVQSVSLRYFNAAGAWPGGEMGEDHDPETHLIPLVLQTALGERKEIAIFGDDYPTRDGTCIRDYIHVIDLAQAHALALDRLRRGEGSGVYNLGNGEGFSVREVINAARKVTGREIPIRVTPRRPGDPAVLVASSDKARSELGWQPKYPRLEEMIDHAWNWHRSHPKGYGSRRGERGTSG